MSRTTLIREIHRELEKLNERIDRKIIKGESFAADARRHRELLATLKHLEVQDTTHARKRVFFRVKSPVRRSLSQGGLARLLTRFAM